MKQKTILFVSKDIGGANISSRIAKIFRNESPHKVEVATEGLATKIFVDDGWNPIKKEKNLSDENDKMDPALVLCNIKPELVIVTTGVPINLENDFALEANALGIPVVCLDDFWGGFKRTQAHPLMVLTLDECSKRIAQESCMVSTKIRIVGNPGVPNRKEIDDLQRIDPFAEMRAKFDKIFVYVAGSSTHSEIDLTLSCLENTSANFGLVFLQHPKLEGKKEPISGKVYGNYWKELMKPMSSRLITPDKKFSSQHLVANADVTLGSFSTLLTTSAACGKTAVSIFSSSTQRNLRESSGLEKVPLVELGCAHSVTKPCDLGQLSPADIENQVKLRPYNFYKACFHINQLL